MAHHFTNIQNSYPPFTREGRTAYFCHSSFEPRSLASIRSSDTCCGIDSAYIFHSHDFLGNDLYRQNHETMVRHFDTISDNSTIQVPVDCSNKNDLIASYHGSIKETLRQVDEIAVDLTTFTRGRMICLLDLIIREKGDKPLCVFYSEPERYATENSGDTDAWLTRGSKKIVKVPGFSGEHDVQKERLLVLLLGHDTQRAISVIEEVDPDMIVVVAQGTLKYRRKLQEVFLKSNASIMKKYGNRIATVLTVPPRGWETVYDVFGRILGMYHNQYNITACLDGTKMQVVGAVTFCQKHPEVELLYMEPERYNCESYTAGVGVTWWMEIPNMQMFKKR